MKFNASPSLRSCFFVRLSCLTLATAATLHAQSTATVTVTLDAAHPRATAIPADFEGASYSASLLYNSPTWLTGSSGAYGTMMKRIGVKSIRMGGTSSETGSYPTAAAANNFEDFAQSIGANVIWGVPVTDNYNVTTYGNFVHAMEQHKSSKSQTFDSTYEVGNEWESKISYATYQDRFDAYDAAFRAYGYTTTGAAAASNANYYTYTNSLSAHYKSTNHSSIGFMTLHYYPIGDSNHISSVAAADTAMLQASNNAAYEKYANNFTATPLADGFVPRLEETNSISTGGYAGASNSFAAALWAVDYYSYMAYNTDVAGLNIHVGGSTANFNIISPVTPSNSYTLNGPGYGLFAFSYNGQGKPLPVTLSNPSNVNLTAYGLVESNGTESMHIVNRTYGGSAVDATVKANPGKTFGHAQIMYLKQTDSDVTANSGITLGGQPVNGDGSWTGGYTVTLTPSSGVFTISVPHAQAAVIHFY